LAANNRILVAGSINTDLVVRTRRAPEAGETVTGTSFATFGGGKGANQAVAAARAGGQVAMLSGVGTDDFGRQRLYDLEAEAVTISTVLTTEQASSGVALITVEESGQNRIAYVPGAGWEVSPEHALAALDDWNPRFVLSTLELPHLTLEALYRAARERNLTIVCNGTPEPADGRDLVQLADVLIVNEQEAVELARTDVGEDWARVAELLSDLGPSIVILTLGAAGALVLQAGKLTAVPTIPVDVVDTTGAGDAFCGAFTAFLAAGKSPVEAAAMATIAGSLAVTRAGAQPSIASLAEIEEAFREQALAS
jgi:ribokinase